MEVISQLNIIEWTAPIVGWFVGVLVLWQSAQEQAGPAFSFQTFRKQNKSRILHGALWSLVATWVTIIFFLEPETVGTKLSIEALLAAGISPQAVINKIKKTNK